MKSVIVLSLFLISSVAFAAKFDCVAPFKVSFTQTSLKDGKYLKEIIAEDETSYFLKVRADSKELARLKVIRECRKISFEETSAAGSLFFHHSEGCNLSKNVIIEDNGEIICTEIKK